jgi:hypothetical protein
MAVKDVLRRMTPLDSLLTLLVGLGVAASFVVFAPKHQQGERVVIERDGAVLFTAPLATPTEIQVEGPLGPTRVQIADGRVRVLDSCCPNKICILTGSIHAEGELLACVPNHIIIRIEGAGGTGDYDLLSR